MTGPAPYVTRANVRHLVVRRRNERISADPRADDWPTAIHMHPETLADLLLDGDGREANTVDFEGREFMGFPIVEDGSLEPGEFALRWAREVEL